MGVYQFNFYRVLSAVSTLLLAVCCGAVARSQVEVQGGRAIVEATLADAAAADAAVSDAILPQGPVHEALVPPPGGRSAEALVRIQAKPPEPLKEPQSALAASTDFWISGYWDWDESSKSFVWVPGFERRPPPGREWRPGAWIAVDSAYVRLPGHWTDSNQERLLDRPPELRTDRVPTPTMIPEGFAYVPGSYDWDDRETLVWRDGYLARNEANRVWVPSRVVERGEQCVLISGYWDYPLAQRGRPFAAVRVPAQAGGEGILAPRQLVPIDVSSIRRDWNGQWRYTSLDRSAPSDVAVAEFESAPPPAIVETARLLRDGEAMIVGVVSKGDLKPDGITIKLLGATARVTESGEGGVFHFDEVPYGEYWLLAEGPVQNYTRRGVAQIAVEEPAMKVEMEIE